MSLLIYYGYVHKDIHELGVRNKKKPYSSSLGETELEKINKQVGD